MPLARFTPSLHSAEQLEQLFVEREHLLDQIVARIASAGSSKTRNHSLVVGPRGAGKTHLISLLYYRTRDLIADGAALQTAWLDEDPWLIASYDDLLGHIVERLDPVDSGNEGESAASTQKQDRDGEIFLRQRAAASGPIVVFLENLDQILEQIGVDGQHQLRSLLQDSGALVLTATSTRLSHHVDDPVSPFYGFFTTDRLQPFSAETAADMLGHIAKAQGNDPLADFLASDRAQRRLKVVEHLAGGQPRMWATFSSSLELHQLDELVDHLMTSFDDLTPYYQEQLARLSPHQRKVIVALATDDRPMSTKQLAAELGIEQRSLSKTMHELVDRGWIAPSDSPLVALLDGRVTYYDLAEPMVRVALQIKSSRGKPLRVIVEFLKGWFDASQLSDSDDSARPDSHRYLETARLELLADGSVEVARRVLDGPPMRLAVHRMPVVEALWDADQALAALANEDVAPMFALPAPVRTSLESQLADGLSEDQIFGLREKLHWEAIAEADRTCDPMFEPWLDAALAMIEQHPTRGGAWTLAITWLGELRRFDRAEQLLGQLTERFGVDVPETLQSRHNLANRYLAIGRNDEALALHEQNLADRENVLGPHHPDTLQSRLNLCNSYWTAGRHDKTLDLDETNFADFDRILGSNHPYTLRSGYHLAMSYAYADRNEQAIDLVRRTVAGYERILGPDHPDTVEAREWLESLR